jgi:hypothetical protein
LSSEGIYTVKIVKFEGKCLKYRVNLTAENKTGKKICFECPSNNNKSETSKPNTEQHQQKSVSGVIIALIILVIASILGGIVYYF